MENITLIVPLGKNKEVEGRETIKNQKLKLITEFGPNPSKNRNNGIKKAKTEFVAFINGHTYLSKDWAKKALDFFKKYPEIDIVGGPQLNYEKDSFFAKISSYALSSIFGAANVSQRYSGKKTRLDADETMLTSANLICRRRVFKKVKFDENLYPGEDPKFISDAKKAGFNVAFSPDIKVYNRKRNNLAGLMKQVFNYGKTRPLKESLIETLKKPFFLVPSLFILYLVLLPLLRLFNKMFWLPLLAYLILSLIFSVYEGIKNKDALAILILPFVFLGIHLSYGTGFIIGSLKKVF